MTDTPKTTPPIDDGGSAFPYSLQELDGQGCPRTAMESSPGMTLRDYFAAHALANPIICDANGNDWANNNAKHAYAIADAMLAARKEAR